MTRKSPFTTPASLTRFRIHFEDAAGRPDHQDIDAETPVQAEANFRAAFAMAALDDGQVRVRKIKRVHQ